MKQDKSTIIERELQALTNALHSNNLTGYEVLESPLIDRRTYILRDNKGTSLTGYWNYDQLNHFIMGYGKALKKLSEHPEQAMDFKKIKEDSEDLQALVSAEMQEQEMEKEDAEIDKLERELWNEPTGAPTTKKEEVFTGGDIKDDYLRWFDRRKLVFSGVNAGEYLDKEDFETYGNWITNEYDKLQSENTSLKARIVVLENGLQEIADQYSVFKSSLRPGLQNRSAIALCAKAKSILNQK